VRPSAADRDRRARRLLALADPNLRVSWPTARLT
jgi:hypothetical protein